jgi:hypothetical protein
MRPCKLRKARALEEKPFLRQKKKNPGAAAKPPIAARLRFSFGHVLLFLSGMVLMALIQVVFFDSRLKSGVGPATGAREAARSRGTAVATGRGARWGDLEYMTLALNRPNEYFTNEFEFSEKTEWVFHDIKEEDLRAYFASLQLDAAAKTFLTNSGNWNVLPDGFRIAVPASVVLSLEKTTRAKLYTTLAKWQENPQRNPFQFRRDGFDQWFADCGLSEERLELVRKLTYEYAGMLCFADARAFAQVATRDESLCLVKSLWRVNTFIMSVRITPETDLEPIVGYWGRGGRAHAYKPMLESIVREGGSLVPISYFLPGFARLRLYTYPNPRDPRAIREDCFWTAMNFFNEQPDDRFFDPEETLRAIKNDYVQIKSGEKQFGDKLLVLGAGNKALHMCVHVADDVVFTKNGFNIAQPWILMKLSDMLGAYEMEKPFDLRVYRRKQFPGDAALAKIP